MRLLEAGADCVENLVLAQAFVLVSKPRYALQEVDESFARDRERTRYYLVVQGRNTWWRHQKIRHVTRSGQVRDTDEMNVVTSQLLQPMRNVEFVLQRRRVWIRY